MGASLDHCMWFHHDLRADEWLLYDTESPIAFVAAASPGASCSTGTGA